MNLNELRRCIRVKRILIKRYVNPTWTTTIIALITYFLPLAIYLLFTTIKK